MYAVYRTFDLIMTSESTPPPPARQRQPPRSGFYGRKFRAGEASDLLGAGSGLQDEIALLRVTMRRVFELASEQDADLDTWSKVLDRLSAAAARLGNLARIQQKLAESSSSLGDALSAALADVLHELGD